MNIESILVVAAGIIILGYFIERVIAYKKKEDYENDLFTLAIDRKTPIRNLHFNTMIRLKSLALKKQIKFSVTRQYGVILKEESHDS
jgi:hypothetical protein